MRLVSALALLFSAHVSEAHDWDAKPHEDPEYGSPFEAWENWRPIGSTATGDAYAFVGYIQRVENAVTFETVVVYHERQSIRGSAVQYFDQDHAHWIADCGTAQIRRTKEQQFLFGETSPAPPINITLAGVDRYTLGIFIPTPTSLIAGALAVACAYDYSTVDGVVPYAFAQDFFENNETKGIDPTLE